MQDLTGRIFGQLTVLERDTASPKWRCICSCGQTRIVMAGYLNNRATTSCRECARRRKSAINRQHGHRGDIGGATSTYYSWASMKARCRTAALPTAKYYLARGITYDPRWDEFEAFLADMGERPSGTTLDRLDYTKDYSRENCRWATQIQQTRNRSNTRYLMFRGENKTIMEWAHAFGLTYNALRRRISRGWPVEDALLSPPQRTAF